MKYTLLIVPGYADIGPTHWQSIWLEHFPNSIKVVQRDWINANRDEWVHILNSAIQSITQPMILVGHSLGCLAIIHWADSREAQKSIVKVKGALLVAPPDPDSVAYRALSIRGFDPLPLHQLPFLSLLVASANDPFLSMDKARYFAACWGSKFVNVGERGGHMGEDATLGEWREGKELLKKLLISTGLSR